MNRIALIFAKELIINKKSRNVLMYIIIIITSFFIMIFGVIYYVMSNPLKILEKYITGKSWADVLLIRREVGMANKELGIIIYPVEEKYISIITSPFGYRVDPITNKKGVKHGGVDFGLPTGSEIYAISDGKITYSDWWNQANHNSGFGKYISINHGYTNDGVEFETVYAHLSKFNVKVGDDVKMGDIIGYSGNTGKSTGPHLHFEIRLDGERVDPMLYLDGIGEEENEREVIESDEKKNESKNEKIRRESLERLKKRKEEREEKERERKEKLQEIWDSEGISETEYGRVKKLN